MLSTVLIFFIEYYFVMVSVQTYLFKKYVNFEKDNKRCLESSDSQGFLIVFVLTIGLFWLAVTASTRRRKKGMARKAP